MDSDIGTGIGYDMYGGFIDAYDRDDSIASNYAGNIPYVYTLLIDFLLLCFRFYSSGWSKI